MAGRRKVGSLHLNGVLETLFGCQSKLGLAAGLAHIALADHGDDSVVRKYTYWTTKTEDDGEFLRREKYSPNARALGNKFAAKQGSVDNPGLLGITVSLK